LKPFPTYQQTESKDCGPTCIKIIAKHYGKLINTQQLRSLSETTRDEGRVLLGLSGVVEFIGFKTQFVFRNKIMFKKKLIKKGVNIKLTPNKQYSLAKNRHKL